MKQARINVLFIIPSLGMAGAERQVLDLANGFNSEIFDLTLFTFEKDLTQLGRLDQSKVRFFNHSRRRKFDLAPIREIARIIDEEHIDVIHCALQIAFLFGLLGKWRAKRKPVLINTLHATVSRDLKTGLLARLFYGPLMGLFCERVIMICEKQRAYWEARLPYLRGITELIHNGIDPEHFRDEEVPAAKLRIRQELGLGPADFVVGMLAGLRKEKGHEDAFLALKTLKEKGLGIKLLLIGDGDRKEILQKAARHLGVCDSIVWVGWQKDPRRFIAICDVTLMASHSETFSIACLESMAMGKPVIATDIGGASEMITDGVSGYLVPAKQPSAIAEAIARVSRSADSLREMGKAARAMVVGLFNVQTMVRKTEEAILRSLDKKI